MTSDSTVRCSMCAADLCCSVCTEEPMWSERQTALLELAATWRSTADGVETLPHSKNDERAIGYRDALRGCASMLDDVTAQQRLNGQQLTEGEIQAVVSAQIASIRKAGAMLASANDARAFLDALIEGLRDEQYARTDEPTCGKCGAELQTINGGPGWCLTPGCVDRTPEEEDALKQAINEDQQRKATP